MSQQWSPRPGALVPATGVPVPPARAARRVSASAGQVAAPARTSMAVKFVYLMWFIVLCDPQWWVNSLGASIAPRIPTVMFAVMLVIIAFHLPKDRFAPLLTFILYTLAIIPFAYDRGKSIEIAKALVAYYVLAAGSLALLKTIPQSVPIVAGQMMYSYVWWIVLGAKSGLVSWHPALGNYDGFGPLMVCGIGSCYYFGAATQNPRERKIAYLAALGCLFGLVSSFARGAVLAGGAVCVWIWLRSRRKLATTAAVVVGGIVFVIAASFFSGSKRGDANSSFWSEMSTVADQGGTRGDREVLWRLARRVYLDHPVFGVGAENFGPYAAQRFRVGDAGGAYDENPARLYDRKLHSTFYQILCEYGTVGSLIFLWMLYDFWRLNRRLRRRDFAEAWKDRSGGRLDLVQLSFGLEAAMVGFLTSGLFYNQIFSVHWFYTIVIVNTLLYYHARPRPQTAAAKRLARSRA